MFDMIKEKRKFPLTNFFRKKMLKYFVSLKKEKLFTPHCVSILVTHPILVTVTLVI